MKLPAPEEDGRRFHTIVQAYGEAVRSGLLFLCWTVVALIAGGIAFLILRVAWSLLLLALRALGEI
jgi:hypothetical protein